MLFLAQERLRILSGLYGLLRPLDIIQPYRLEMSTKIGSILGTSLHDFWKKKITSCLNNDLFKSKSKFLFNLSSQEYFESVDKNNLNADIINFDFKIFRDNKLKAPGMMIKKYRGIMAKFIITNKIVELEKLKTFNEAGFKFDEEYSSMISPILVRQKDSTKLYLGFDNFRVITKYNRSSKYALAVHQLAIEISDKFYE